VWEVAWEVLWDVLWEVLWEVPWEAAVGGAVEGGGAIGPAYRHFMTEQIVHIGKGARAADFG